MRYGSGAFFAVFLVALLVTLTAGYQLANARRGMRLSRRRMAWVGVIVGVPIVTIWLLGFIGVAAGIH